MKVLLPIVLVSIATVTEARYHAAGRSVLAPRQYPFSRRSLGSIDLAANIMLRTPSFATKLVSSDPITSSHGPQYVVSHHDGIVALRMELPGVSKEDLDISLENGSLLRIQGHGHSLSGNDVTFDQLFELDKDVDPESLQASLKNGILRVTASRKAKKIQRVEVHTTSDTETSEAFSNEEAEMLVAEGRNGHYNY